MPPYRIPSSNLLTFPYLRQILQPQRPLNNAQLSRFTTRTPILSHIRPRSYPQPLRNPSSRPSHTPPRRPQTHHNQIRHNSTPPSKPVSPDVTSQLGSPEPTLTLSQRMRKLSREYGWAAFGVYMGLSALDFPFCFLAVRALGTERIGQWEHAVVTSIKEVVGKVIPFGSEVGEKVEEGKVKAEEALGAKREQSKGVKQEGEDWSWGVDEAQKEAEKENATLWTQLVLAYAIHKSFIFIRVPLTAAVTPKVVKTLRGWGWNIGKRPLKKTSKTPTPPSSS